MACALATCAVIAAVARAEAVCSPPPGTPPLVTAGQETYLCVVLNDRTFAAFKPTADQFSVLHITDCEYRTGKGSMRVRATRDGHMEPEPPRVVDRRHNVQHTAPGVDAGLVPAPVLRSLAWPPFHRAHVRAPLPTATLRTNARLRAANTGVSAGTGFIKEGSGWVPAAAKGNDTAGTYYVTVAAASGGLQSIIPKVFKVLAPAQERTVPLMTAVVHVDQGEVTFITWDEGCLFCDENDQTACMKNSFNNATSSVYQSPDYSMCAQTKAQCDASPGSCDLQVRALGFCDVLCVVLCVACAQLLASLVWALSAHALAWLGLASSSVALSAAPPIWRVCRWHVCDSHPMSPIRSCTSCGLARTRQGTT